MQRNDAIRAIKERLNIVDLVRKYVDLKSNGNRWVAPCPFHQETKPSFSVNADLGMFHCFGCQASGDIFDFYSKINGLDFKDCLEQLAAEAGVSLDRYANSSGDFSRQKVERGKKQDMFRMYALAAAHFTDQLHGPKAEACRAYIEKRGLSKEILEHFGIGWACDDWHALDHALQRAGFKKDLAVEAGLLLRDKQGKTYDNFRARLIFPIKDLANHIIAFGGRIIADDGKDPRKYINSADSPIYKKGEHLYGLAQARRGITAKGCAMLTEGYMDVLTLHQFGYENAVGGLGTALTPEQVKRLAGFTSKIILLYDADGPGRKAALKACKMFLTGGLDCSVVLMPEGEDIDTYLRAYGTDAFEKLMRVAPSGITFCLEAIRQMAPREGLEWVQDFLGSITLPELVTQYISVFSSQLRYEETTLRKTAAVGKGGGKAVRSEQASRPLETGGMPSFGVRERQILMFAVRYPQNFTTLKALGADLLIQSPEAKQLWTTIEKYGENFVYEIDEREKRFLNHCRGDKTPPLDSEKKELSAIENMILRFNKVSHKDSLFAAIQGAKCHSDFGTNQVYLDALQQTLEQKNEQS